MTKFYASIVVACQIAAISSASVSLSSDDIKVVGEVFQGCYFDPHHELGYRYVNMHDSIYEGYRLGDCEGSDVDTFTQTWNAPAEAWIDEEGEKIMIDFRPKGVDKAWIQGTWDEERGGIAWTDGNLWSKLDDSRCPSPVGEVFEGCYHDPHHPLGYRRVTMYNEAYEGYAMGECAGSDVDVFTEVWKTPAEAWIDEEGQKIMIDFRPKGVDKAWITGMWDEEQKGIAWTDGNLWSKIDDCPEETKTS